ncbi:MAG TPA: D-alanine--D-alanine ligase [Deltaproteobacteria bacterium]|nr:D-alanine--D-alanine ligase [Pseudomonadota bacterium]HOD70201.1 D-alanine--D-alanine ligase [Deltaproteobacteria bacterium]HQM19351.1 D-alanine--D-alanine ligase [Deltaproteobacteria bacterium]HRC98574.1 D-alanine--D-alanine ligase [Deltaproteobacteria bacterium]
MAETVLITHNPVGEHASEDEKDVLVQAFHVAEALEQLGYQTRILPFDHRSRGWAQTLQSLKPLCIFNLVESLDGDGRLIHLACSLLDHLGISYTGAPAEAMFLTSNKVLAKRWMHLAGVPTPEWIIPGRDEECICPFPGEYIIKAIWEEASIGIDQASVVRASTKKDLLARVSERSLGTGRQCFAERFIDGREFNLSILAGSDGPQVLPPAEIVFSFPPGKRKIVDYRAKWDESSFEYQATVRSFDFPPADAPLLSRLTDSALACWRLFELRGYARVDFRVDEQGGPWVLEINANPCISPDSGFVAAAERAGIPFRELVGRIVADAARNR